MSEYLFNQLTGPAPGDTSCTGLNNTGAAVGSIAINPGTSKGAIVSCTWSNSAWSSPSVWGNLNYLWKINDSEQIVSGNSGSVWSLDGTLIVDLSNNVVNTWGVGTPLCLFDIKNAGIVAGAPHIYPSPPDGGSVWYMGPQALVYDTGFYKHISPNPLVINPLPGQLTACAYSVNLNAGLVVGSSENHGFLYFLSGPRMGQMVDLGLCCLCDVNENGIAVGWKVDNQNNPTQPIWVDCTQAHPQLNSIALPPGNSFGVPWSISPDGTIVGFYAKDYPSYQNYTSISTAFVSYRSGSTQGVAQDLNKLTTATGWHLIAAYGINDAGHISGDALNVVNPYTIGVGNWTGFILEKIFHSPMAPHHFAPPPHHLGVGLHGLGILGQDIWGNSDPQEREVIIGLAMANLAKGFSSREVRQQIQRAALELSSKALAHLQNGLSSPQVHAPAAARAILERYRRPIPPHRSLKSKTKPPHRSLKSKTK